MKWTGWAGLDWYGMEESGLLELTGTDSSEQQWTTGRTSCVETSRRLSKSQQDSISISISQNLKVNNRTAITKQAKTCKKRP
jgi:hypothetical protein